MTDPGDHLVPLARLDDLEVGASRGFSLALEEGRLEGFLVRTASAVFAYRNSCPHTGAPLDWTPDNFLDIEGRLIQCALHGALFEIETGLCIYGPCVNRRLTPLPIAERKGTLFLERKGG